MQTEEIFILPGLEEFFEETYEDETFILPGLEEFITESPNILPINNLEKTLVDIPTEIDISAKTTCLALTVQKQYMPIALHNVFFHSVKLTLKIAFSTIFVTLLKLFV